MKRICVFCGSNSGADAAYAEAARELGAELARRNIGLVYGGGKVGLMGMLADSVLAGGGEAIGIIPEALFAREVGHTGLTELHVVGSMHERKAMMAELSDAFITLPGGFGTMEEFFEVLTWGQLGIHRKPCGLLNVNSYYDGLLAMFNTFIHNRFAHRGHLEFILVDTNIQRLVERVSTHVVPETIRWIAEDET